MRAFLSATLLVASAACASAQMTDGIARIDVHPGWRTADGAHMAALHVVLEPGWKTYWRAPGDVGIPPHLDWSGSENVEMVRAIWPTPVVFFEQGARSVGYLDQLLLPIRVLTQSPGEDIALSGEVRIGVCKDICIPAHFSFTATLPSDHIRPDPRIAAAMAQTPFSADEAQVAEARCTVGPEDDAGYMSFQAEIDLPHTGGTEHVVIETGNPYIWVAEPSSSRSGGTLAAHTKLAHVEGKSYALNRSDIRITVLGSNHAVDIRGCSR